MGTELPIESPDGPTTEFCWTSGQPFAPGPTPEFITLRITGVGKGPTWDPVFGEPRNGDYIMQLVAPDNWLYQDGTFQIGLDQSGLFDPVQARTIPGASFNFFVGLGSRCDVFFENDEASMPVTNFEGGTVQVLV